MLGLIGGALEALFNIVPDGEGGGTGRGWVILYLVLTAAVIATAVLLWFRR